MFILLAVIAACALAIAVHFLLPDRELRGVAVVPAIAAVVAALVYTGLQWAGVAENNFWLWLASIGGGLALSAIVGALLTAQRRRTDETARTALGI